MQKYDSEYIVDFIEHVKHEKYTKGLERTPKTKVGRKRCAVSKTFLAKGWKNRSMIVRMITDLACLLSNGLLHVKMGHAI